MSLSADFMISLFILFTLIALLFSLLTYSNSNFYVPALNENLLTHKAHFNSFFVTLNSYSLKHGTNEHEVDCIISNKVYCKNNELNLTGEAPVYLRRGGGN